MASGPTMKEWSDRAGSIQPETRAFIGGAYVDVRDAATMPCISPIDGRALAEIAACEDVDVDCAVETARAAFEGGA